MAMIARPFAPAMLVTLSALLKHSNMLLKKLAVIEILVCLHILF